MLKLVPIPLLRYAQFTGRMSRSQFLRWLAVLGLVYVFCSWVDLSFIAPALGYLPFEEVEERYVTTIAALLLVTPLISSNVRRLHDVNRSGWWMLLAIPTVAILYFSSVFALAVYGFISDPSASAWLSQDVTQYLVYRVSWLVIAIAMLSFLPVIYWSLKRGKSEENRFGPRD